MLMSYDLGSAKDMFRRVSLVNNIKYHPGKTKIDISLFTRPSAKDRLEWFRNYYLNFSVNAKRVYEDPNGIEYGKFSDYNKPLERLLSKVQLKRIQMKWHQKRLVINSQKSLF